MKIDKMKTEIKEHDVNPYIIKAIRKDIKQISFENTSGIQLRQ